MWKDIKDWEELYEVSDSGEVRNKQTKHLIVGDINSAGYYRVCLYNKNHIPSKQRYFRHRLVAEAFLPNPNNLPEVNHIDHILSYIFLSNLEWVNRIENELDSRKYGSKEYKPFKVYYDNGDIQVYDTKPMLAKLLGVTHGMVKHWLHKKSNSYTNFGITKIEYI